LFCSDLRTEVPKCSLSGQVFQGGP
jgi:hypothetical protein